MKALRFITASLVLVLVCNLHAQTNPSSNAVRQQAQQALKPGEQPVTPRVIKKLPEKQQAMFDQMAVDLQLTSEQKDKMIQLTIDRSVSLTEAMKSATTDEAKATVRKANADAFKANVDKEMGVELADKIRAWQREYTLKQRAAQAPAQ